VSLCQKIIESGCDSRVSYCKHKKGAIFLKHSV